VKRVLRQVDEDQAGFPADGRAASRLRELDCAIAARHIPQAWAIPPQKQHPITLLRIAYGLE
jgi:hypothetical protein